MKALGKVFKSAHVTASRSDDSAAFLRERWFAFLVTFVGRTRRWEQSVLHNGLASTAILVIALHCGLSALTSRVSAAPGDAVWTNRFKGAGSGSTVGRAVAVDGTGNVFVAGGSSSVSNGTDYATVAYSAAGVPLWTNHYNGPGNGYDFVKAVAVDAGGNVIVTGESAGGGSGVDYATIKYSGAGVPLWTNRYNGTGNASDCAMAVAVDVGGNVFVTGHSTGSSFSSDYATVAYSGAGVPLWTNRFNGPANSHDYAYALAVDGNGNVFVTGSSIAGISADYATVAYSGAGVPLWTNRYGSSSVFDSASALVVDGIGNVFVTGRSYGDVNTMDDYATVAYSGAGVPLWTNRYNGPGNAFDSAAAAAVDGSGNVFVTGTSRGSGTEVDYATVAYSGAGVPLWTNRYNGPGNTFDSAAAAAVDGSGNVFVTGTSRGSGTDDDYATVAYSGAGMPLWTNRYNGPVNGEDAASTVAVDRNGNVLVTGYAASGTSDECVTIKYATLLAQPTLSQASAENGQFRFLFNAEANLTYAVEFRDFLTSGSWTTLTSFAAQPVATNLVVTNTITNNARYFRVRTP